MTQVRAGGEDAALHKSADGGLTWTALTGLPPQPSAPGIAPFLVVGAMAGG